MMIWGGISYVDFDTKLSQSLRFASEIIGRFLILFLPIIFSSKLIGLNNFSIRLWYVFEGPQNHHFLMVLQVAFQLNSFSLKSIQHKNDSLDLDSQGTSTSKSLLTIPIIKILTETRSFKVRNHRFLRVISIGCAPTIS